MHILFTFKNIESSDTLKSHVQEKLDKLDRMLDKPAEADLVLSVEKERHIAELNLRCNGLKINMKEEAESFYSAIDTLSDKLKLQIKKNKEKYRRHLAGYKETIRNNSDMGGGAPENPLDDVINK